MKAGTRYTDRYGQSGTTWIVLRRSYYRTAAAAGSVVRSCIRPQVCGGYWFSPPVIRRQGDRILIKQRFGRND